jgi:flavin-dependent dehydrogenase
LIIPRLVLDDAIRSYALAGGAKFESLVRVTDIAAGQEGIIVTGKRRSQPFTAKARLAIIATGASIPLLLRLKILKKAPPMALAARAYFENVGGLSDSIQLRFDGVPMPGYGWVFPLPDSAANIGAGIFPAGWDRWRIRAAGTARAAFDAFVQAPALRAMLTGAVQAGPIMGYPLRMDFAAAPTYGRRVLLVGEAAGLVNPLTGEGIDYALESGKIAAEFLIQRFENGDPSSQPLVEYDRLLRQRFQRLFVICTWIRDLFVNPLLINPMVSGAARRPDLKLTLINFAFGQETTLEKITIGRVLKKLLNLH